jgi:ketosteroid isomerase-like protein
MSVPSIALLALWLLFAASNADAASGGHFRLGANRIEARHAIAVASDEGRGDAPRVLVYLSDFPLDAGKVAAAFDPEDEVRAELGDRAGGYVRVCIDADGAECGMFFNRRQPDDSFNTSGYGTFELQRRDDGHVAGSWVLAQPESFFDQTYDFDLSFDLAVTPLPGAPLPADGGEPGRAYRAWLAALAKGDVAALRQLVDSEHAYRFPEDDSSNAKESIKDLRDGTPLQVEISRGLVDGDRAVLWVEGSDRDDIRRAGRVLMVREGGEWRFDEDDLESVDE